MNSWPSKITISLALLTACGTLNSCRLFGGGQYASQTEIETDVPDSLEKGRPTEEPAVGRTAAYATANGVPATSNLIETAETIPTPGDLSPLPGATPSPITGGAALTSVADSNRELIDIPKPDFGGVSVHNPRPPAQMLTLEAPPSATPRMSASASSRPYTSGIVKETAKPVAAPSGDEIANAPKATKTAPEAPSASEAADPGIPLLHGNARLSDFYAVLHQPLLDQTVVENNAPAGDPNSPVQPSPADSATPPAPPPGSNDFASPPPQ